MEKFSGANFCFWVVVLVLCFLVGFCYCFCFIFWRSAPETVWKNSIDVRSGFFSGFVLSSLGFSPTSFLFFFFFFKRDIDQVVTGHPFTRTCVAGSFSFCVPPLLSVSPVLAVRPASRRFSRGAILGPARF